MLAGPCLAAPAVLRVTGFGGSSNLAIFVAQDQGFFAREGVSVAFAPVRDSATQLGDLIAGRADVALTAMDNVVAFHERDPELVAIMGVNAGTRLQLFAERSVPDLDALRGKKLAVDAIGNGYAFVLEEMLRQAGLRRDDYELVSVGGSRERWEALRGGRVAATLLNAPYDVIAREKGFPRLATSERLGAYQGSVGAVRRPWAEGNVAALVAFIRAYVAAVDWLHDPGNKDEAVAILVKRQERLRTEEAASSYRELIEEGGGSLQRRARIDFEGIGTVLALRRRFARPPTKMDEPSRYYESRYYEQAVGR